MPVQHLDPATILDLHADSTAPRNPYPTGYGRKIPTRYRITLDDKRTRRVYCMCYGNAGSLYVLRNGRELHLDSNTEHDLSRAL